MKHAEHRAVLQPQPFLSIA